jgi:hypothetical protein
MQSGMAIVYYQGVALRAGAWIETTAPRIALR